MVATDLWVLPLSLANRTPPSETFWGRAVAAVRPFFIGQIYFNLLLYTYVIYDICSHPSFAKASAGKQNR